jgi:hypothetical protein
MMSAALGRPERRNDSELPAQSWNSSQTSVGFGFVSIASAIADAIDFGSASTEAIISSSSGKGSVDHAIVVPPWRAIASSGAVIKPSGGKLRADDARGPWATRLRIGA